MSSWDSQIHFPTLLQHAMSEWSMRMADPAVKPFLGKAIEQSMSFPLRYFLNHFQHAD
jgi:hypothetical protein